MVYSNTKNRSTMSVAGTLTAAQTFSTNDTLKRYASFTSYQPPLLMCSDTSRGYIKTFDPYTGSFTTKRSFNNGQATGLQYNSATDKVLLVNETGELMTWEVAADISTTVSTNGQYKTFRGDKFSPYVFGLKIDTDGTTNQLFRVDLDGTNEVAVSTASLFGTNQSLDSFTVDSDNELVYFHDLASRTLRSVSWDLTGFTTHNLFLQSSKGGSIAYSRGYIYYGGVDQSNPNAGNSNFYRYNISNGEIYQINGVTESIRGGTQYAHALFLDPDSNRMMVSGESKFRVLEGTDFDYLESFMTSSTTYYDGVRIQWTLVSGATSYRVVVNDVVGPVTTETEYDVRGYSDGDVLDIKVEYSSDDATYTNAQYRTLEYVVQGQFTTLFTLADTPTYPRPTHAEIFVDPYNPAEYVLTRHGQLSLGTYNIDTGTLTEYSAYQGYKECRRIYQTQEVIGLGGNQFRNLGANLSKVIAGEFTPTLYVHSATINGFDISYGGTVYFSAGTEIWSLDSDFGNAQLLFSTTGTAGSVATDPYNPDTLVYVDGTDIKYRVLSTGVTTDLIVGNMETNTGIFVLNGVMYTNYFFKPGKGGYVRMNLDGTNVYEYVPSQGYVWSFGFVLDTVNKRAITLEDNEYFVHTDGSIANLPPDPSSMMLVPRPIFIEATWSAIEGATSYRVSYSLGQEGVNPEIVSVFATTELSHSVRQLQPETEYTVYLYYSTGSGPRVLSASRTVTTTQNLGENYDKSSFAESSGAFSLTDLDATSLDALSEVLNEIFDTGDEVEFNIGAGKTKAKFVKRGGSTPVEKGGSLAIPFVPSAGAGQNATLVLSDSSSVVVSFDETSEELTINGQSYTSGQSLVLDNQKVTVIDA